MTPIRLLTAAAVSALLAGPAFAGPDPAQPPHQMAPEMTRPAPLADPVAAPAADEAATPASTIVADPSAGPVVQLDSPTSPTEAWRLKAGDPSVVSNAPVPDTAENRALYGGPMSNGGRRTRPAGN